MEEVPEKISFPEEEQKTLKFWDEIDAFQTSLKKSEGKPEYSFYDGPPFATGLPHYGHILAGTIKDTVTRYAHQTGHHVVRRFGWDTHGLPIEFEIDKQEGIKTKEDVLKIGIPAYNAKCREIVMKYADQWKVIVNRLGRWIDMDNPYKTMDIDFMESVWAVFAKIYNEKQMVYRGFKVMPYSTGCTTPLSNFESNLNYKDVTDPTVIVAFPIIGDSDNAKLIAWTTTPWTLPSNLALCVNPQLEYVRVKDKETGNVYILCEARLIELYKPPKGKKNQKVELPYEILSKFKGETLKDLKYEPLFPYFKRKQEDGSAFRVILGDYVTSESGTGVVHCAPAFGEDDYTVCKNSEIIAKSEEIPCPVDANGCFTEEVSDFKGVYVKDADKNIIKTIKEMGRLVHQGNLVHSYPFCWRSETPLIYKTVPSWFIKVEDIRERLLENNKNSYWVPEFVQEKRFANWLGEARDWAVSRNRYWGTPLPIWISDDGVEKICIGSVKELEEKSGVKVTDLHRESVDHITIPSQEGRGDLHRVEEVFDCWFESGSMPYAQLHWPFENTKYFEESFPADFIAEGIDQTRGWFYTLLVISTILFDKAPFKNLIVNGLVLASDGKKMSKRLKNYPDPTIVVDSYGADALRLYLINSPVVRAESLKFQESGVRDVIKDVFLPWFNAYRFLVQNVRLYEKAGNTFTPDTTVAINSTNVMDKWVLAACNSLIQFVVGEMKAYRLYTVVPKLVKFIEQLTNWYVRLNRKRIKGVNGDEDCKTALCTLFEVVFILTKTMAPFTPFFTDYMWQNIKKAFAGEQEDSVHYLMFPDVREEALNPEIETAVGRMQNVIELARAARDRRKLPLKYPLTEVIVITSNDSYLKDLESLQSYITSELNVRNLNLTSDEGAFIKIRGDPDFKGLGQRLRGDLKKVATAVKDLSHEKLREYQKDGKIEVEGHVLSGNDIKIVREFAGDATKYESCWDNEVLVLIDLEVDQELRSEGIAREVINRVQKLRKTCGVLPSDPVACFYKIEESDVSKIIIEKQNFIESALGIALKPIGELKGSQLGTEEAVVNEVALSLSLTSI